jgi:hypothetical protein
LRQLCLCSSDTSSIQQQVFPPSQKYRTQHTAFHKQILPSSGEWFHLKKEAGRNVMRDFEYFYDGRKTCCKCCWYHLSTGIVKSMYVHVTVMRVLFPQTLQQHSQNLSYLCKIYEVLENLGLSPTNKTYQGKAIPLQAWAGPEGSRRQRLPHL